MPILTNLKRTMNEKKNNLSTTKKWGIILTVIASVGYSGLFIGFLGFLKSFLLGIFGLFAYVLFMGMYFVAGLFLKNKKFEISKRYILLLSLALFSILAIFHMAFSSGANFSSYFAYLGSIYSIKNSIGGLLLGLFVYPFQKLLGFGAYVLFGILLIVCVALIADYLSNMNGFKEMDNFLLNHKHKKYESNGKIPVIKQEIKPIKLEIDEQEKTAPVGLQAEIEKEETQKDIAMKKLGLDQIKNKSFGSVSQYNNQKSGLSNLNSNSVSNSNLKSNLDEPIFLADKSNSYNLNSNNKFKPEDFSQSFGYNIRANEVRRKEPSNNEKNIQFLQATLGIKPKVDATSTKTEEMQTEDEKKFFNPSSYKQNYYEPTQNQNLNENVEQVEEQHFEQKNEEIKPIEFSSNEINLEELTNKYQLPKELQLDINNQKKRLSQFNLNKKDEYEDDEQEVKPKKKQLKRVYIKPPMELLNSISTNPEEYGEDSEAKASAIERTLENFKIPVKLEDITIGPSVTRYEYSMPEGISVNKVYSYQNDIAMAVASKRGVRIEAPIPGKKTFGIEVPNEHIATVALRDILDTNEFNGNKSLTTFGLGKEISGSIRVCDIAKMPHLLIAGSTGSGKSVCLNCLIISLLYRASPEDLRFILIDPKRVEFTLYNNLPHLLLPKVVTEPDKAISALTWAVNEMERRYSLFENSQVKNLAEYNKTWEVTEGETPKLPVIVIVIDEVSDLMMQSKKDVEEKIARLAQKARAAGIHLVLATQRPSVDVITGTIKNNFPSRIAFCLTSVADSRTILDAGGAEQLLGKGDMLYAPQDASEPIRIQGCFVSDDEVKSVVDFIKENNSGSFDEEIENKINKIKNANNGSLSMDDNGFDPLVPDVLKQFIMTGMASTSFIQRRFRVGYNRAGTIIDQLTNAKFISPSDGSNRPRSVYLTREQYNQIFGDTDWGEDN